MKKDFTPYAGTALRLALGIAMLSAVADRFGLWGTYGTPNVAWGNWDNFIAYTHQLNYFVSLPVATVLGTIATALEILLGLLLVAGYKTKKTAFATGVLLLAFAFTMTLSLSVKVPLDFSVFSSAAGAFALSCIGNTAFALDNYSKRPLLQ